MPSLGTIASLPKPMILPVRFAGAAFCFDRPINRLVRLLPVGLVTAWGVEPAACPSDAPAPLLPFLPPKMSRLDLIVFVAFSEVGRMLPLTR